MFSLCWGPSRWCYSISNVHTLDITISVRYHYLSAHTREEFEGTGRISRWDHGYDVSWWYVPTLSANATKGLRYRGVLLILGAIYYAYVCTPSPALLTDLTNTIEPWRVQSRLILLPFSWAWFSSWWLRSISNALTGPLVRNKHIQSFSYYNTYQETIAIQRVSDRFLHEVSKIHIIPVLHLRRIAILEYLVHDDIEGNAQYSPRDTCT